MSTMRTPGDGGFGPPDGSLDRRLDRLLDAMVAVASDLSLSVVLRRIVESACALVDARYGALGVVGDDGRLSDFVHVGVDDATTAAIGPLPEGKGILGRLIVDPRPLRLRDLTEHPDSSGFPPHHPEMRSFLGVPILVREQVFGNLYLCEKRGGLEFAPDDESLAIALATAAGVAIENARLHETVQGLAVLEERERIARDLHDKVIQQLFATGMALQATEPLLDDPVAARRIAQAVDDLDATIREVRNTIFSLHTQSRGFHADLVAAVDDARHRMGLATRLHVEGPVDHAVPAGVAEHVLATLGEALTNVARHARAHHVDVLVAAGADLLLRVVDDGVGIPVTGAGTGHGLRNLRERAEGLGGALTITARPGGGTVLEWRVPLDA